MFLDPSARSLNADTHAPSPHKSESGCFTVDVELPLIFLCIFEYFRVFHFHDSSVVWQLKNCTLTSEHHNGSPNHHFFHQPGIGFTVQCACQLAVIHLDLNLLLTFKWTKWTQMNNKCPMFFFLIPSIQPHLWSRVARLRTNKKVKANLGRFGSHGFGMPLEVPGLSNLLVLFAHIQEKAKRLKTRIVGYGMLPRVWSYLYIYIYIRILF